MKKKKIRFWVSAVLLMTMLAQVSVLGVLAKDEVTITKSEYDVYYPGVATAFLCNDKTLGSKPGTEYFLTYTVEDVTECGDQSGLIGTSDPDMIYPYIDGKGIMYYKTAIEGEKAISLFEEGYTYFIKYIITESGYRYTAARASATGEPEYFTLNEMEAAGATEDTKFNLEHFGIWIANGVTNLKLSHVRFYDKDGNDLGLYSKDHALLVLQNAYTPKADDINHRYTIEAKDIPNLAISNAKPLTTNKMYIEYTVKESTSTCNQNGVAFSNEPKENFPHLNGLLKYYMDCSLLQVGADYLITLEKLDDTFTAVIQITKDGKTTYSTFPLTYGTYKADAKYFSLWFGEGTNYANLVLENVKFYDANKNHLGLQTNNKAVSVVHEGEVLDYVGCEAVYYNRKVGDYYILYQDQTYIYVNETENVKGEYAVAENVLTLKHDGQTEEYDYLFQKITSAEDKVYDRLGTYKVRFVSGAKKEIETQVLDITTGYTAQKPETPVVKDYEFKSWCLADGTDYDFESIVTKSTTLYAKWVDDAGKEYVTSADGKIHTLTDYVPYIAVSGCAALLAAAVVGCVIMVKRGAKYGTNKKER